MLEFARLLATMWRQRWDALREDEGASTIEYAILVILGIAVATAVAAVVTTAVTNKDKQIK